MAAQQQRNNKSYMEFTTINTTSTTQGKTNDYSSTINIPFTITKVIISRLNMHNNNNTVLNVLMIKQIIQM